MNLWSPAHKTCTIIRHKRLRKALISFNFNELRNIASDNSYNVKLVKLSNIFNKLSFRNVINQIMDFIPQDVVGKSVSFPPHMSASCGILSGDPHTGRMARQKGINPFGKVREFCSSLSFLSSEDQREKQAGICTDAQARQGREGIGASEHPSHNISGDWFKSLPPSFCPDFGKEKPVSKCQKRRENTFGLGEVTPCRI